MAKLSVCVISKNEERCIERCLASVSWADEIIVVDSGSTDKTVPLATSLGATVLHHEWPGWAQQKNYAINHATHDWILSLDADEWLPEEAEEIIRSALQSPDIDAYFLARRTTFLGKWIRHSGWYPDRQIRLFRKSVTRFEDVPVHEKVAVPEKAAVLPVDLWHESYTSLPQYFAKNKKYAAAQAAQQIDQSFVRLKLVAKPLYRFFQTYLFQLGFLDGYKGLLLALLRSWYEFRVLKTILRLRRQQTARQPKA